MTDVFDRPPNIIRKHFKPPFDVAPDPGFPIYILDQHGIVADIGEDDDGFRVRAYGRFTNKRLYDIWETYASKFNGMDLNDACRMMNGEWDR